MYHARTGQENELWKEFWNVVIYRILKWMVELTLESGGRKNSRIAQGTNSEINAGIRPRNEHWDILWNESSNECWNGAMTETVESTVNSMAEWFDGTTWIPEWMLESGDEVKLDTDTGIMWRRLWWQRRDPWRKECWNPLWNWVMECKVEWVVESCDGMTWMLRMVKIFAGRILNSCRVNSWHKQWPWLGDQVSEMDDFWDSVRQNEWRNPSWLGTME